MLETPHLLQNPVRRGIPMEDGVSRGTKKMLGGRRTRLRGMSSLSKGQPCRPADDPLEKKVSLLSVLLLLSLLPLSASLPRLPGARPAGVAAAAHSRLAGPPCCAGAVCHGQPTAPSGIAPPIDNPTGFVADGGAVRRVTLVLPQPGLRVSC